MMRVWLAIAMMTASMAGCEGPGEPAPAAQLDPLEDAIARGRFPDEVARVLRRLATLPPGTPSDVAEAHLGLRPDQLDGGYSLGGQDVSYWAVAPGYRVEVATCDRFETRSNEVVWVNLAARQDPNGSVEFTRVGPYWDGRQMRYD